MIDTPHAGIAYTRIRDTQQDVLGVQSETTTKGNCICINDIKIFLYNISINRTYFR
jgi:hypothetical protein